MKKLWKAEKKKIIASVCMAIVVLAADITSRPYFAVGGGAFLMIGVVAYWIFRGIDDEWN